MMWQDLVFTLGSSLSIVFLAPTLRDATARVPLGTSVPSMVIGGAYAFTFSTLGMTFSAAGALIIASMWALIATFRSPGAGSGALTRGEGLRLLARDARRALARLRGPDPITDQFASAEEGGDASAADHRRAAGDAHAVGD